jgi:Tfp pilus assembly protein FimV
MPVATEITAAIIVSVGVLGAVAGILQNAGLLNNTFQSDKTLASSGDPLRDAESYLAYGRKAQAIDILNTAIQRTPSRAAEFRKKISEIQQKS